MRYTRRDELAIGAVRRTKLDHVQGWVQGTETDTNVVPFSLNLPTNAFLNWMRCEYVFFYPSELSLKFYLYQYPVAF